MTLAKTGEYLRRITLALFSALFVARAFYPSEDAVDGTGMWWTLSMFVVLGLGVIVQLLGERTLFRFAWADVLVLVLVALVGASVAQAHERRAAITLGWEWAGIAAAYLVARNLTRSRRETAALAAVWVATAAATAIYGLFQGFVEIPELQAAFRANPDLMLRRMGVEPGTPAAAMFQARVLDSKEPFSTFALANSLAGFLVGPLALLFGLAVENLKGKGPRVSAYLLAAAPALATLICLLMTKSRSSWIGLAVAGAALGVRAWARTSRKSLLITAGVGATALAALVAFGLATKQLDRQVLTESSKSMKYRLEYWRATWDLLNNRPSPFEPKPPAAMAPELAGEVLVNDLTTRPEAHAFWLGLGPGNFAGPYLRHKLPESSEEIQDPHNMVLELWAIAGLPAAVVLLAALGAGLVALFRSEPGESTDEGFRSASEPAAALPWILAGGPVGWMLVALNGRLDPFKGDLLARWLILGAAWGLTIAATAPLWRRRGVPSAAAGAAVLAIAVNLLAAGGIGTPTVALGLWVGLAIGLSLREGSPSGRLRESKGLAFGVCLAFGWAALMGTFAGSVGPGWKSEAAVERGNAYAVRTPPAFEDARREYLEAADFDRLDPRPWLRLADLEYRYWLSPDAANRPNHWQAVFMTLVKAVQPPLRDPDSLAVRRTQAAYAREIGRELDRAGRTTPGDQLILRNQTVRAMRNAARLYPTSAEIRSRLAFASADMGMFDDALEEAGVALKLDGITPHADKKLSDRDRRQLQASLATWEEARKAAAEIRDKGRAPSK